MKNLPESRKLFFHDLLYAGILQAYRIQHSGRALRKARKGISRTFFYRRAFEGNRAQNIQVIKLLKLFSESKGTRSRYNRIVQFDSGKSCLDAYHTISFHGNTGPSVQMRFIPERIFREQPMQAPNPQPIRSSKLNCPSSTISYTARSIASGPQEKA